MSREHKDLPRPFAATVDAAIGAFFYLSFKVSRRP